MPLTHKWLLNKTSLTHITASESSNFSSSMQQWSLDFLSFLCGLIINWWWGFNHCVRWSICDLVKCLVASSVWRPFARYLMHKFYIPTCQGKVFGAQHICRRKHIFNLQQHLEGEIFLLYIWCWKIFISSAIVKCLLLMWHWAMSCDRFPVRNEFCPNHSLHHLRLMNLFLTKYIQI